MKTISQKEEELFDRCYEETLKMDESQNTVDRLFESPLQERLFKSKTLAFFCGMMYSTK